MRNGENLASARAGHVQPAPEVLCCGQLEEAERHLGHFGAAEDLITVQHATVRERRGILVGDESGEAARLVKLLGGTADLAPGPYNRVTARWPLGADLRMVLGAVGDLGAEARHHVGVASTDGGTERRVMDFAASFHAPGVLHQRLDVVGDRREVERLHQPLLRAVACCHLTTPGKEVGVPRAQLISEGVTVEGVLGMDVEVAEIGVAQPIRLRGRFQLSTASNLVGRPAFDAAGANTQEEESP